MGASSRWCTDSVTGGCGCLWKTGVFVTAESIDVRLSLPYIQARFGRNALSRMSIDRGGRDDAIGHSGDDADALKDFDPEKQANAIREATATALKNDASFIDPLRKSARGEVLSSKERKYMKLFGISKEEYDQLPEATKFDSLMELGYKKMNEKAAGGEGDDKLKKDLKTARDEIVKLNSTIKKYEEETIPELKNTTAKEREAIRLENLARKTLSKHEITVDPDFAFGSLMGEIKRKYDVVLDDKKESLSLKQKGSELDVIVDNKKLTFNDALKAEIEANGIAKKSNAGASGAGGKGPGEDEDGKGEKKYKFAGSKKAEQRAEELAKKKSGSDDE